MGQARRDLIHWHGDSARPSIAQGRNQQRCRFHGVVIDDQMNRNTAESLGQAMQHEVLEPDAGMTQLRLMAAHQNKVIRGGRQGFAGLGEILTSRLQQFGASLLPQGLQVGATQVDRADP